MIPKYVENKKFTIIETFYELACDVGLENASVYKLARHMEIPTSLIFYYFENKQNLKYELVEYVFDRCLRVADPDINTQNPNVQEEYEQYINSLLAARGAMEIDSSVYFSCMNFALKDAKAREMFAAHDLATSRRIQEKLEYFKSKGVIRCSNIPAAVKYISLVVSGLQDVRDLNDDKEELEEYIRVARSEVLRYLNSD